MNLLHSLNTFRCSIVQVYSEFQTYKSICTNHWCVYKSRRLDSFCYFSYLVFFFITIVEAQYQNYLKHHNFNFFKMIHPVKLK